ncbi:RAD55 family ATPase [Rhizobacter sp. P5_C2]
MANDAATDAEGIAPLPFGIPMLDELFGLNDEHDLLFPKDSNAQVAKPAYLAKPTSLAIVGQDGTGKSIFALHLASTYMAMHGRWLAVTNKRGAVAPPRVFYLSSDLGFRVAERAWSEFGLDNPWRHHRPFIRHAERQFRRKLTQPGRESDAVRIDLVQTVATMDDLEGKDGQVSVTGFIEGEPGKPARQAVAFLDLCEFTTGDDWLFATRLVSSIERQPQAAPNLLIIDSVEGFETLVGEQNAFGERMSRRARIAQLVRASAGGWHVVMLVEEPENGKRHPEEYIADSVLHLRRHSRGEMVRRLLEIEKCRGRSFASGEHPYEIRSGRGTSTGQWENPDDPRAKTHSAFGLKREATPYVQIFASLNYLSRKFSANVPRPEDENRRQADKRIEFGIRFLDDLLAPSLPSPGAKRSGGGGIAAGSIASLIGDGGTHKEELAACYLLHQFAQFSGAVAQAVQIATSWTAKRRSHAADAAGLRDLSFVHHVRMQGHPRLGDRWLETLPHLEGLIENVTKGGYRLKREMGEDVRADRPTAVCEGDLLPYKTRWDEFAFYDEDDHATGIDDQLVAAMSLLRLSGALLTPVVYVTTRDVDSSQFSWSIVKAQEKDLRKALMGFESIPFEVLIWQLRRIIERFVIVRRIDSVDLTAPQLWQIVDSCVQQGLDLVGREEPRRAEVIGFKGAGEVRVVISDLRHIRDILPDVAADPLFLSVLVFRLRRLGVTALLVDTDHGRPDMLLQPGSLALRAMVDLQILTWRVPFFGEERVAIAVSPRQGDRDHGVIRELVSRRPDPAPPEATTIARVPARGMLPADVHVDPHFELYADVERGNPQPVPLLISLWGETEAFRRYAIQENELFRRLFTGVDDPACVVKAHDTASYSALRDFAHLMVDTRLPYTHVFVVDGFWALKKRASLRPQADYLFESLESDATGEAARAARANGAGHEPDADPHAHRYSAGSDVYGLFARVPKPDGSKKSLRSRAESFQQLDGTGQPLYRSRIPLIEGADRVPFTWDFAFLICDEDKWNRRSALKLDAGLLCEWGRERPLSHVGDVWKGLHRLKSDDTSTQAIQRSPWPNDASAPVVPWRAFIGACRVVADAERNGRDRAPVALDIAGASLASTVSLLFEIWISEIVRDANRILALAERATCTAASLDKLNQARQWAEEALSNVKCLSMEFFSGLKAEDRDPDSQGPFNRLLQFIQGSETRRSMENRFHVDGERQPLEVACPACPPLPPPRGEGEPEAGILHWESSWEEAWRAMLLQLEFGDGYALQLYKAWLLLSDALDMPRMRDHCEVDHMPAQPREEPDAVATRHYYTTACDETRRIAEANRESVNPRRLMPVRMPGHFTMRGDWFLAVARGSRSNRLADMALDLLTSRRANRTRLEMGLGLPTRDLLHGEALGHIRTGLTVSPNGDHMHVSYGKLLWLGGEYALPAPVAGPDNGKPWYELASAAGTAGHTEPASTLDPFGTESFFWLFRSGFDHYYRYDPLMRNWVARLVAWTAGFDEHELQSPGTLRGCSAYDKLSRGSFPHDAAISPKRFAPRLEGLRLELGGLTADPVAGSPVVAAEDR